MNLSIINTKNNIKMAISDKEDGFNTIKFYRGACLVKFMKIQIDGMNIHELYEILKYSLVNKTNMYISYNKMSIYQNKSYNSVTLNVAVFFDRADDVSDITELGDINDIVVET